MLLSAQFAKLSWNAHKGDVPKGFLWVREIKQDGY